MFAVDYETGAVSMHRGDTGSYTVTARRKSGADWTEHDRLLLTVWDGEKALIQRFYRLDNDETLGNGVVLLEFKNEDTDDIAAGNYMMERRYIINPTWELDTGVSIPTERVSNALTAGARIVNGHIVRTTENGQTSFEIKPIYGEV